MKLAETLSPQEASSVLDAMKSGAGEVDGEYLGNLFDGIMTHAASGDASVAASLAESHAGESYAGGAAMARVSVALAGEDPVKALEWAAKMDERQGGDGKLLSGTIKGMSLTGLEEAESWLASWQGNVPESLFTEIDRRRRTLEDRGSDQNGYDRED